MAPDVRLHHRHHLRPGLLVLRSLTAGGRHQEQDARSLRSLQPTLEQQVQAVLPLIHGL